MDLGLNDVDLGLDRLLGDDAAQADDDGAETAATSAAPATPPEAPRPAGVISPAPPPAAPDGVDPADHGERHAERPLRLIGGAGGEQARAMVRRVHAVGRRG
ncbi:MAG: hypothetical protein AAFU61_01195, partial [Pseudomonadota bacterium]